MNCADYREDLEAYALGALDLGERRRIAAHISECKECEAIVQAYQSAVDYLALSVPMYRAAPRLKQRILGGIGVVRRPVYLAVLTNRWVASSAAVLLIAFAVGGLAWASMLSAKVQSLQEDNRRLAELTQLDAEQRGVLLRLQGDLNSARTEQRTMSRTLEELSTLTVIALDPDLVPTSLEGTVLAPQSRCSYVWSTKQSVGALTCKDLPSTTFSLTYELWAVKGEKTVPLGTFLPRFDGSVSILVKFPPETPGPVANMWVTLEQQQAQRRDKPSPEVVLQKAPEQQAAR
ncbi:MAG TPA: anti-sigma factor [Dehalococcoidia bacterium]|nr:anti-sigma factor [Dehalococcoidia bacterium]